MHSLSSTLSGSPLPSLPSLRHAVVAIAVSIALGACGGGGGGGKDGGTAPPPAPATILAQPATQAVVAGQAVTFTVNASGSGLSYQWQRNGANVAGATGSSYTLASAQVSDDGSRWTVVISSAGGNVTSSAAVLSVKPPLGISIVAGQVSGGAGEADGPIGRLAMPRIIAVDKAGVVYLEQSGNIRTVTSATAGDAIVATRYKLSHWWLTSMAMDAAGNLVATRGNRLFKITPAGVMTPLAGTDDAGSDDGAGTAARFNQPQALAIGADGTIYVADKLNRSVRTVSPAGVVTTHAAATAAVQGSLAQGQEPTSVAIDGTGNLYINAGAIIKVTPSGAATKLPLSADGALVTDSAGNLYAQGNCAVQKMTPDGKVSVLAGMPGQGGITDGAGAQARFGTLFNNCTGWLAIDGSNQLYYADTHNHTIRKITPDGVVSTIAGKPWTGSGKLDGTGAAARFDGGSELATDAQGNVYMQQGYTVRKVTPAGVVKTLNLPEKDQYPELTRYFPGGLAFNGMLVAFSNGVISQVDGNGTFTALAGKSGSGAWADGVGMQASFGNIMSVARDGQGNLYVVDWLHSGTIVPFTTSRVRKITPAGVVTTLYTEVFDPATPDFRPLRVKTVVSDKDGNLTMTDDYNRNRLLQISAGGKHTLLTAAHFQVEVIALDKAGNLYWAGHPMGSTISVITRRTSAGAESVVAGQANSAGVMTGPLPGSLGMVTGMTVDDNGTLLVMSENALLRIVQ